MWRQGPFSRLERSIRRQADSHNAVSVGAVECTASTIIFDCIAVPRSCTCGYGVVATYIYVLRLWIYPVRYVHAIVFRITSGQKPAQFAFSCSSDSDLSALQSRPSGTYRAQRMLCCTAFAGPYPLTVGNSLSLKRLLQRDKSRSRR